MSTSARKWTVTIGLVAVLVMGLALPGQTAYTKLYYARNYTGVDQSSLQAVTNGLEAIVAQTIYPGAWGPATVGFTVTGGVYCTTLAIGGSPRAPESLVKIGWTTADQSCRVRDLRWGGGQPVVPYYAGGVPGGGMVFYDYPDLGCLTVVITNDTDGVIALSDVDFAISGSALDLEGLQAVLEAGLVEWRVANIDADIDVIRAEIESYGIAGELPGPSANSLIRKLDRAAAYKHDGLDEYLAGDLDGALIFWAKAAKQIDNFISEVTASAQKGNLALVLYERWVVDGDGEIATAPAIEEALLALPDGQALQTLTPLPCGTPLPAYPGLDPNGRVQWPVDELYPGEYTAFSVCNINLGAGFIMAGSVADETGEVVLEWLEQSVAEPAVIDTEPPVIKSATATPSYLWPPDHSMVEMTLNVTIEDASYATWYVAGVTSNQPEDGTGDGGYYPDWVLDPNDPQALWLRSERSANHPEDVRVYTVTLMAIDAAGNLSEPYDELHIEVYHDQG